MAPIIEFFLQLVALERFLAELMTISRKVHNWAHVKSDMIERETRCECRLFTKPQTCWLSSFFKFVAVRSFAADSSLLQPTGGVSTTRHTSHVLTFSHLNTRTCVAQVISLTCAHHIPWVIFMRSCCVCDSLRLLHFLLFAVYLLSYRPVFPPGHLLHLPRCGGQVPCALSLMRTLALLPSTTLLHLSSQPRRCSSLFKRRRPWLSRPGNFENVVAMVPRQRLQNQDV